MTDSIELHRAGGNDKWGEPLADTVLTIKGRFNIGTALVKDIKGENVYSSASVMIASQTITHEDRIKFDGKEYVIINIKKPRDFSWGYLEVFLK
jgi:hypothetical protein